MQLPIVAVDAAAAAVQPAAATFAAVLFTAWMATVAKLQLELFLEQLPVGQSLLLTSRESNRQGQQGSTPATANSVHGMRGGEVTILVTVENLCLSRFAVGVTPTPPKAWSE